MNLLKVLPQLSQTISTVRDCDSLHSLLQYIFPFGFSNDFPQTTQTLYLLNLPRHSHVSFLRGLLNRTLPHLPHIHLSTMISPNRKAAI
jgi:hypothetical protein